MLYPPEAGGNRPEPGALSGISPTNAVAPAGILGRVSCGRGSAATERPLIVIDRYVAELDGALRGPRHAKADLITEARDSLVDAAVAYEGRGLSREAAQRRAVCEFGDVREIAPGYQTELGLTQARRTALLLFFALVSQTALAECAWRSAAGDGTRRPVPGYLFLAELVDRLSVAVSLGSLAVAAACGIGIRVFGAQRWLARVTGVFALVACGFFGVAGVLLTVLSPMGSSLFTNAPSVALMPASWAMSAWIVLSARRCLAAA